MKIKRVKVRRKGGSGKFCTKWYWRLDLGWDYDDTTGKRRRIRRFFATETAAREELAAKRAERIEHGAYLRSLTTFERSQVSLALARLKDEGATLQEAVEFFLKHRDKRKSPPVADVVAELLNSLTQANRSPAYLRSIRCSLKQFARPPRETMEINDVRAGEIEAWLNNAEWSPITRQGYLTDVRTLFSFALTRGYVVAVPVARPKRRKHFGTQADLVTDPIVDEKAPGILTVRQCEALLRTVQHDCPEMLAFYAIGLFGGLRSDSEVRRLKWGNLKPDYIEVFSSKSRGKRRLVTLAPNLRAWLEVARAARGEGRESIIPANFDRLFDHTRILCGLFWSWPNRALRHSYASYYLAHHRDAAQAAHEMGHGGRTDTLERHYKEIVMPEEAAKFWALMP
ncbi:MAG: hypothetical protein AB1705_24945 [Verrucomicrobiota bacterium]